MKRAGSKLPHILWNPEHQCWWVYTFKGASRPVAMYAGLEIGLPKARKFLKKRHDAMVKRREDQAAARKWYDFKAKHDIELPPVYYVVRTNSKMDGSKWYWSCEDRVWTNDHTKATRYLNEIAPRSAILGDAGKTPVPGTKFKPGFMEIVNILHDDH